MMVKRKESGYGEKMKALVHTWTSILAGNHPGELLFPERCVRWLLLQSGTFPFCFGICSAAGGALCVVCHPFDASYAHAAMVEDTLSCFHDVHHATLKDKPTATNCYEVIAKIVVFGTINAGSPPLNEPLLCFFLHRHFLWLFVGTLSTARTFQKHINRFCLTISACSSMHKTGGYDRTALPENVRRFVVVLP